MGEEGTLVHSEDWIMKYNQDAEYRNLLDIVFANSKFFAVGQSGTLIFLKDGVEWTKKDYGTDITLKGITLN